MNKLTVKEYIDRLKFYNQLEDVINCETILDQVVKNMTYNSKESTQGTMFICKGFR